MRVFRSFAIVSLIWAGACANSAAPTAESRLTLDSNSSTRVAGELVDKGQTLRFVFTHDADCYRTQLKSGDGQELLQASSCSDGDMIALGDRVTLRAPAGGLLGGVPPRWTEVQTTGKLEAADELFTATPLALTTELTEALAARGDVDTAVLAPALLRAAQESHAAVGRGPVVAASNCGACTAACVVEFSFCNAIPFAGPWCTAQLVRCENNCYQTLQCP
jgi:hypothetical protein